MRVLMLGGARDEVVPRSQMQELWAIIRNRGRARDAEKLASLGSSSSSCVRGSRIVQCVPWTNSRSALPSSAN